MQALGGIVEGSKLKISVWPVFSDFAVLAFSSLLDVFVFYCITGKRVSGNFRTAVLR